LFGLFIKLVLGGLFLVFWYKQRSAPWYAWWSASLFLASAATVLFATRGFAADLFAIGIGNVALIAAFVCNWQAARVFGHRRPFWIPIFAVPTLWFVVCLVPAFIENTAYRIVLSSLMGGSLLMLAAAEMWRDRAEQLPSRWPIMVLFSTFAIFFLSRIALIGVLPFPFGALPMQSGSVGAFNLILFFHTLLITVLIVAMSKERLELDQRMKAQTDPLTGALNRRAFMSRGERLLRRHGVEQKPLCLLFLDLDQVAQRPIRSLRRRRRADEVRRGGSRQHPADRFPVPDRWRGVLLPSAEYDLDTGAPGRGAYPSSVRNGNGQCRRRDSANNGQPRYRLDRDVGYDLYTLMRRADMAVYAAKRQGRNCVVLAVSEDAAPAPLLAVAV